MREPDEWWRQAQPLILQIFVCLDFLCSFFPIGLTLSLHYFESFYLLFSLCFAIFCIRCFLLFYLSVPLYLFILLFSNILLPRFLFFVLHSVYVHLNVVLRINPLPAIYFPHFFPGISFPLFLFLFVFFFSFSILVLFFLNFHFSHSVLLLSTFLFSFVSSFVFLFLFPIFSFISFCFFLFIRFLYSYSFLYFFFLVLFAFQAFPNFYSFLFSFASLSFSYSYFFTFFIFFFSFFRSSCKCYGLSFLPWCSFLSFLFFSL